MKTKRPSGLGFRSANPDSDPDSHLEGRWQWHFLTKVSLGSLILKALIEIIKDQSVVLKVVLSQLNEAYGGGYSCL